MASHGGDGGWRASFASTPYPGANTTASMTMDGQAMSGYGPQYGYQPAPSFPSQEHQAPPLHSTMPRQDQQQPPFPLRLPPLATIFSGAQANGHALLGLLPGPAPNHDADCNQPPTQPPLPSVQDRRREPLYPPPPVSPSAGQPTWPCPARPTEPRGITSHQRPPPPASMSWRLGRPALLPPRGCDVSPPLVSFARDQNGLGRRAMPLTRRDDYGAAETQIPGHVLQHPVHYQPPRVVQPFSHNASSLVGVPQLTLTTNVPAPTGSYPSPGPYSSGPSPDSLSRYSWSSAVSALPSPQRASPYANTSPWSEADPATAAMGAAVSTLSSCFPGLPPSASSPTEAECRTPVTPGAYYSLASSLSSSSSATARRLHRPPSPPSHRRLQPLPRQASELAEAYSLTVRQQPLAARMCGFGERDRRVIDPPPIVQLHIQEGPNLGLAERARLLKWPYSVMHCSIWDEAGRRDLSGMSSSDGIDHQQNQQGHQQQQQQGQGVPTVPPTPIGGYMPPAPRRLTGNQVANPFIGLDEFDNEGSFFCFPDLSCRTPGTYRLRFSLVVLDPARRMALGDRTDIVAAVMSDPFHVYAAKDFPGMRASSALARRLKEQGCNHISIKKGNVWTRSASPAGGRRGGAKKRGSGAASGGVGGGGGDEAGKRSQKRVKSQQQQQQQGGARSRAWLAADGRFSIGGVLGLGRKAKMAEGGMRSKKKDRMDDEAEAEDDDKEYYEKDCDDDTDDGDELDEMGEKQM